VLLDVFLEGSHLGGAKLEQLVTDFIPLVETKIEVRSAIFDLHPAVLEHAGLEAALREFAIDVRGLSCLDVGASTGGFTDCLLQHGARKVIALDVGHNQIDWRLRTDPRVEVREGVNARYLTPADFAENFPLAVMDVAFISATKVLPAIAPLLTESGRLITLIKPQFEVGRGEVGKGGIVREPEKHQRVIAEVNDAALGLGFMVRQVIESPLRGQDGNVEFLALYERTIQNRER